MTPGRGHSFGGIIEGRHGCPVPGTQETSAYRRQNRIDLALSEIGRIDRPSPGQSAGVFAWG
jgi:hypothetical protein